MRDIDEINIEDGPTFGPLDFVYIDDWEDLSRLGADLHHNDRRNCEDDINNMLDIQFVQCAYDNRFNDEEDTELVGSLVALVPYGMIDADYTESRNALTKIVQERGYGAQGNKTRMEEVEEDE